MESNSGKKEKMIQKVRTAKKYNRIFEGERQKILGKIKII